MLLDLDRRLVGRLRVEHLLHAAVLGATLLLRLWWLDKRPLHHDESIHALAAWRIATGGPAAYAYDPVYHGPTLYYGTAAFLGLLGASDFAARMFPVVCGVALAGVAWPLRPLVGRREALAFAVLIALSPTIGYYSRSLRHDVPFALALLGALVALARWVASRRKAWAYLAGVLGGFAVATKEDAYLFAPILLLSLAATVVLGRVQLRSVAASLGVPVATGGLLGLTVALVLYTSFLTHPDDWNPVGRAVGYWWGQHVRERVGGPWWYYLPFELAYEPLVFLPALATALVWVARPPVPPLRAFLVAWTAFAFAAYSWAQEKVPWLLVSMLVPQALLAAHHFARCSMRGLLVWTPVAALGVWSLVSSNYLHDALRPGEREGEAHYEPLAYVQTTYDVRRVLGRVAETATALGTGMKTPMVVAGEAGWPLGWYLRDYPVWWGSLPPDTDAPILIVDERDAERVGRELGTKYEAERFALRGWWLVDRERADPANVARFLLLRRAWNRPGTSDAVLFTLADPHPGIEPARVTLTPTQPMRAYPSAPEQRSPVRTLGGPDVLREPRGVAVASDGTLIVADTKHHRVVHLGAAGEVLGAWGGPEPGDGPGQFREPCGVAVGPDGAIYVADTWNHRIQQLDTAGRFVREWRDRRSPLWGPRAVVVAPDGTLFVADTGNKRIVAYPPSGAPPRTIGREGNGDGQFIEPVGLALDPDSGRLWVADTGNRRVQAFEPDGRLVAKWLVYGWSDFHTEPYLAWSHGVLWATDSSANRVNGYDRDGRLMRALGGPAGGLARPIGVAATAAGDLVVADTMHDRVVVFAPDR
ncbi:MAG TPA: flippase activity-associated protein Agl23 [Candidatus Binatia bacterium]|nr:flippase activity-associated protein Agl23 [Candidatus Binatia bacterium]